MSHVVLLGPQRHQPSVVEVVKELGLHEPLALISAGWKERESEDGELREALGRDVVNLELNRRYDAMLEADAALAKAVRRHQESLRELQQLYRVRLASVMHAARQLFDMDGPAGLIEAEREHAVELVRQLDRHHLGRVADLQRRFADEVRPDDHEDLMRHKSDLSQMIHDAGAVLLAGGHVAVLLNRLRLFNLGPELRERTVIAWSAGAMVAGERIVLFHDSPPQGQGHAEVLDRGLDLFHTALPLPNGSARLRLGDRTRVALLAQRFAELRPVVLDAGVRLDWLPPRWRVGMGTWVLGHSGRLEPWEATT
jgi:hypothetical protein